MDIRITKVALDPSEIPYDITFVIEECGSKVKAHKVIMAMGSPMCKKQFFGELKENNDKIWIKSTTKDAFVTLVDFLYGKEVDWSKKTIEELFGIADMAEKYQVDALKEDIEEAAKRFPLNEQNVVPSASIAEHFSHIFENLAETILMKCRELLSSLLIVRDDFCEFANKYAGTELSDAALRLLAGMKSVKPTVRTWTCCELKSCRRGKPMMHKSDFNVGDRVKVNPEGRDYYLTEEQLMNSAEGTVVDITNAKESDIYLEEDEWLDEGYAIVYDGVAAFLFSKC